MTTEGFKRKLTTMFSADVAGYSRLMAEDEAGTVKTLKAYREVMAELIKQHRGRVVDSPGDNVLAEFASVVDAVQCAVSVQKEFQARNAELPENRRMEFRIGVNLGDVIEEEDRIYGDGVNIAARLESLADPGGICISKTAFDQIEAKLPLGYEYIGEKAVKNIPKPVGAYRVLMEPRVIVAEEIEKGKTVPLWRRKAILAGGAAVVLVFIVMGLWQFYMRRPSVEPASVEKMAFPLPEEPSIAVLPFTNMSGDPDQEYFSDGFTQQIINALSKAPRLFVIARHSAFTYKDKTVKVQQVAEELGVRYVLEGSVQKAGEKVRITAQLIDVLTGRHLWSEKYDRDLKDLFALQDEIALRILSAVQVKLTEGEQARWSGGPPQKAETVLKTLEASRLVLEFNKASNVIAKRLAEEIIAEDPKSHLGYVVMAEALFMDPFLGLTTNPKETLAKAVEMAQKAIALGARTGHVHGVLAYIYGMRREYDKAIAEGELAVQIEPSGADGIVYYGNALMFAGRAEEAIPHIQKGLRLNPYPPTWYYVNAGHAHLFIGQYEKALTYYKEAKRRGSPSPIYHRCLAATYALLGRQDEARVEAEEVMRLDPSFSLKPFAKILPFCPAYAEIMVNGLRKAGLK